MLTKIFSVVSEPFAIAMVLGMIVTAYRGFRRKFLLGDWLLLLSCVFMVAWRCCCGAGSSRYWAIVLFPAIYYSAVFCWSVRKTEVALGITVILLAFAAGKAFHFNPNGRFVLNAAEAISRDARNYSKPLIVDCNTIIGQRLAYYTRLPVVSDEFSGSYLQSQLHALRGLYDVIYLVCNFGRAHPDQRIEEQLNKLGATLIFRQFHDRYEKKKTYIYRLSAESAAPRQTPVELFENGNFEILAPRAESGSPEPASWGCTEGAGREVKITTSSPAISGERSLLIRKATPVTLFAHGKVALPDDGDLLFTVKNADKTRMSSWLVVYDSEKNQRVQPLFNIVVNTDEIHQFQLPLKKADFRADEKFRIYWSITSPSGIMIDDVGFGPENVNMK